MRTLILFCLLISSLDSLAQGNNGPTGTFYFSTDSTDSVGTASENITRQSRKREYGLPEIKFNIGKTRYSTTPSARVQSRYDMTFYEHAETTDDLMFRRVRIKSDGHLISERLDYQFQIDLTRPVTLLDAILQFKINHNFSFWAGQTKLQGNREMVISSQDLQFVDRSRLNEKFNIDRDIGVWLHHDKSYGKLVVKESISVTKGEGLTLFKNNDQDVFSGLDYTGRVDVLPFGEFTDKGDYSAADLAREESPKLSVGISYDYNDNASKSRGQLGDELDKTADLRSIHVDAIYKYRGFSYLGEYANRKASDITELFNGDSPTESQFYTGYAINNQVGYVFKNNFEVAVRHTIVRPASETGKNDLDEYTFGISKYIIGHKIKVQSDISLLEEENKEDRHIFRIQLELSI